MASFATNPNFSPATTISTARNRFTPFIGFLKPTRYATTPILSCSLQTPHRRPEYIPNHIPDPNYVRVLDTTLRDGEQSAGVSLTAKEKLDIARQLANLGVDIIEAGFPAASESDFEAVKAVAKEVGNAVDENGHVPVIMGIARCHEKDIARAWEALKYAKRPRIHGFLAVSEIHMKYKLNMTEEEVIERAKRSVEFARSLGCNDFQFCAEDAGRSDREFLCRVLGEVIKAGATTLNIPDTVGYNMPDEFRNLISYIKANTPGIENVILSTHCQNDLGLATANTLAGASAGARQVEVTINGIGERAGNASLEEVVMALKCRGEEVFNGLYTSVDTKHILNASKMVEEYSGLQVQPHKAIVGANAFVHQSGIHQDGMLKNRSTYEIINPEEIGLERSDNSRLSLGKLSGRHALKAKFLELGYDVDEKELNDLFWRFKAITGMKKIITDDDLIALIAKDVSQPKDVWKLIDLQVMCGTLGLSTSTVQLMDKDGKEHGACASGKGPIDSAYKAVDLIVKPRVSLLEYSISAITEGNDAVATTRVIVGGENYVQGPKPNRNQNGKAVTRTYSGTGESSDIVVSSVRAYIDALNMMFALTNREMEAKNRQTDAIDKVVCVG